MIYCRKAVFLNWRAVTYHPKSQLQSLEKVLIVISGELLLACGVIRPGMQSSKLQNTGQPSL